MAKYTNDELLEAFGEMTLVELSEFVKAFEEKFDVEAAAPAAVANGGEDDVELVLLFLSRSSSASNSGNSGNRSGSLDVELLLEGLHELGELDQGHLAEGFQQLIVGVLSHYGFLSILAADEVVDPLPNKPYCLNYRSD